MKKHVIIFGLLVALVITALSAGCGGGSIDGKSTAATTQSSTTSTTTSAAGTTTAKTTSPSGTTTTPAETSTTTVQTSTTPAGNDLSETLGQAANFPTVKYDMISTVPGAPAMTLTYWMKNQKFRIEMQDAGIVTLLDMVARTYYMYTPAANIAIKMVFDTSQAPAEPDTLLEYEPNVVGTETIDGKTCTIIQYSYQGATTKTWIWNDNGFPVKMEMTSNGETTIIEYKNFDFSDIPDNMFVLPEGVQIIEMGG